MKDFELDSKIDANKERLKIEHNNLRNIQNSYGYIMIYISFIGFKFFDIMGYFINDFSCSHITFSNVLFFIFFLTSLFFIFWTLIVFIKLFVPRYIAHEKLPEFVYKNMFEEVGKWAAKKGKDPVLETKKAYLEMLEKAVRHNYQTYIEKRNLLRKTIKLAIISLIPYFCCIVIYNLN